MSKCIHNPSDFNANKALTFRIAYNAVCSIAAIALREVDMDEFAQCLEEIPTDVSMNDLHTISREICNLASDDLENFDDAVSEYRAYAVDALQAAVSGVLEACYYDRDAKTRDVDAPVRKYANKAHMLMVLASDARC